MLGDVHTLVDEVDLEHVSAHVLVEFSAFLYFKLAIVVPDRIAALGCARGFREAIEVIVEEGKHVLLRVRAHVAVDLQARGFLNGNLNNLGVRLCIRFGLGVAEAFLELDLLALLVPFEGI